jgi:hypothetical protein
MCVLIVSGAASGCSKKSTPETVSVRGRVTLDGKPLEGATVGFLPQGSGRPAMGTTDAAGQFTLTTFAPGDGALPGQHAVTVSKLKSTGQRTGGPESLLSGPPTPGGPKVQWVVPAKYADPKTSGFMVEVQRGMEPVQLGLKSK